jgi:hypothetical protein
MKTSEAEKDGGRCPKCIGGTTQDLKHRGFVRHIERLIPADPYVPRNEKGLCRYGRGVSDFHTSRRRSEPSPEERERYLREAVIVSAEPILAGTGYWGRAEREVADAVSDEEDRKRMKEMIRRREELALQLKDLSTTEREQILLEEIKKWKK